MLAQISHGVLGQQGWVDGKPTVSQMAFSNAEAQERSVASSLCLTVCVLKTTESEEEKDVSVDLSSKSDKDWKLPWLHENLFFIFLYQIAEFICRENSVLPLPDSIFLHRKTRSFSVSN